TYLSEPEMVRLAQHGIPVSVSPMSELRLAMGFPPVRELHAAGVRVSLSLDTTAISASADPFQAMRVLVGIEGVRAGDPLALAPHRAIELATIEGARSLGLGDLTGSITPGKRADLILVQLEGLNTSPAVDPVVAVVHSASPSDVEMVIVDGRVLKRNGQLVHVTPAAVVAEADAALVRVCARAGFTPPSGYHQA
ncbi:MAG: amidohydrolase family protein, partial [Candidatus Limnocylindrales bacterium]